MRVLLLDIGNTRLKWGVGENSEIRQTGHLTQAALREQGMGALIRRLPRRIDAVIAGNVAGHTVATRLSGVIGVHTGQDIRFVKTTRSACGVTNGYTRPRRLGVDRWLALIGAWGELGRSCLVVDAGTAVTIDALDGDGQHLGGQILPGIRLMAGTLASSTADIPPTPTRRAAAGGNVETFGHTTRAAVQSGALGAVTGAVERALAVLRKEHRRAPLVLTGGDGPRIVGTLHGALLERPHLVLQGLLRVHEAGLQHD
jgi:type III pantothenate kinase